jgi:hypothetical protein
MLSLLIYRQSNRQRIILGSGEPARRHCKSVGTPTPTKFITTSRANRHAPVEGDVTRKDLVAGEQVEVTARRQRGLAAGQGFEAGACTDERADGAAIRDTG